MKELAAIAGNATGAYTEATKAYRPMFELIFLLTEPTYRVDLSGALVKERGALEQVRIGVTKESLDSMLKLLQSYRDDLEKMPDPNEVAE